MREKVIINEVGPRDGLQNQPRTLTPQQRVALTVALSDAGLRHIEVGSFVSPKAVPQMAGTDTVLAGLPQADHTSYSVLVPNQKGYDLARQAGARNVALVLAATDTMSLKNIGMSAAQVLDVAKDITRQSKVDGIAVQAYISVAFECPFEGAVAGSVVEDLCAQMLAAGADEVVIADTIGAANPVQVHNMLTALVATHGAAPLSVHFHDTRAMALANCYAALQAGIRKFDSSIGGLGGCPFAPGASGNVATEDVVMMLEQSGFDTGIDMPRLIKAALLAEQLTGNCPGPRAKAWLGKQYGESAGMANTQPVCAAS
jgi:hydroxymethylglutaryl-CoA lyase